MICIRFIRTRQSSRFRFWSYTSSLALLATHTGICLCPHYQDADLFLLYLFFQHLSTCVGRSSTQVHTLSHFPFSQGHYIYNFHSRCSSSRLSCRKHCPNSCSKDAKGCMQQRQDGSMSWANFKTFSTWQRSKYRSSLQSTVRRARPGHPCTQHAATRPSAWPSRTPAFS